MTIEFDPEVIIAMKDAYEKLSEAASVTAASHFHQFTDLLVNSALVSAMSDFESMLETVESEIKPETPKPADYAAWS